MFFPTPLPRLTPLFSLIFSPAPTNGVIPAPDGMQAAVSRPSASGTVTSNTTMGHCGAEPNVAAAGGVQSQWHGQLQHLSVLLWGDHSLTGSNVN